MDFEFSPEQVSSSAEVEAFLDANDDPEVFDVTRENMAQIVDTPRAGSSWPSSASGAGSGSPGPRSTAARTARASTSTC